MNEETYPQWQPTPCSYTTLFDFVKFVSQMVEDWGGNSCIELPKGFAITYESERNLEQGEENEY
jgi:hypothetical protein